MRLPRPKSDIRLRLFDTAADAGYRRRRLWFLAVWTVISFALIWPLFGISVLIPSVLGLPGPMAWTVGCLVFMFGALLWLRAGEPDDPES